MLPETQETPKQQQFVTLTTHTEVLGGHTTLERFYFFNAFTSLFFFFFTVHNTFF